MPRLLKVLLMLVLLSANVASYALPKNVQLEYDVARNGKLFATVKETFTQDGKQYRIKSVTKGLGIYALMGERVLISNGAVTKNGLKPMHFELHQGKGGKKTLIADFDWPRNQLRMQVKGETKTEKLTAGTQDLASYAYQFIFRPPGKNAVDVTLTTGKSLKQYHYRIIARDVAVASYKTLQISNEAAAGEEKKQLWLAQEQYYLPVRYKLTDEDGEDFEQTLTKLSIQ